MSKVKAFDLAEWWRMANCGQVPPGLFVPNIVKQPHTFKGRTEQQKMQEAYQFGVFAVLDKLVPERNKRAAWLRYLNEKGRATSTKPPQ